MFAVVKGDLFDSPDLAIGHGVNVKGVMGSGIALPMRQRFPNMHNEYVELCRAENHRPGQARLHYDIDTMNNRPRVIANIASQENPGSDARYEWLVAGVTDAILSLKFMGVNDISLPKIGCGIGGLDWEAVRQILKLIADQHQFRIIVYSPEG